MDFVKAASVMDYLYINIFCLILLSNNNSAG